MQNLTSKVNYYASFHSKGDKIFHHYMEEMEKIMATQSVQAESRLDEVYVMNIYRLYKRIEHLVKHFPFLIPSQSTLE